MRLRDKERTSACFVTEKFGVESLAPDVQDKLIQIETEPGNKTRWQLPVLRVSRGNTAQGQRVAVIGAGPGLACAHDLALMGYRVTVFEASEKPGGMIFHGAATRSATPGRQENAAAEIAPRYVARVHRLSA